MENGQACSCFNGTQDEEGANYSAPVPVIGLYIAGATLVCLSLIVGDLVNAFRSRLFWVPCRFFSMNSFTLTVVGVVTKIPVDLTTPMPDGQDQLAKIYGTSLLFIFMVLFIPSVGKMTASERIPNLASLTLIVITVIVNICMQIGTGLIFKFVVEHVVIMVLMLLTLCIMWSSNTDVDTWLHANIDGTKDVVKYCQSIDGPGLDQDMKLFLLGKLNVPELLSCKFAHYPTMGILCATCFIVSSEATFRAALHQKTTSFFGQSVTDYKWSMWVLVGTQIVTTLVGSVSIGLKSLFLARQMKPFVFADKYNNVRSYQLTRSFMPLFRSYYLPKSLSGFCIPEISRGLQGVVSILQFIIDVGMEWTDQVLIFLVAHVLGIFKNRNRNEMEETEFRGRFPNAPLESFPVKDLSFNKWLLVQSSNNTELLIEKERLRNPQSSPLIQLLSGYHARPCASSMQQLDSMKIGTNEFILFVLLVEATYVLPPSDRTRSLVFTFDEVFDVLYFIGENPVTKDYVHDYTMWIGRDYWMRRKTSNHCFQGCLTRWRNKLNHDVGRILRTEGTISFFQRKISIGDLLNIQENETLDALYKRIEELFICLLQRFLNRLPDVIFKYIIEGSYKDFSERATMCLKFLCRLNLIDARVQWSETNIISFITREATGVPSQVDVVAAPDGATALVLDHIVEVTSGESSSQTQTITDDYGSEIVHRIATGILALFNASRLTIGISGEEQGDQTIISSDDNSGIIIALIAASITSNYCSSTHYWSHR
ncbi:hypothetical protein Syun_006443 [Stephania yunnanensis]|uniref:Uncharacterized protein n=1 Tax=Stephania yunnanensis TaxID=152371 RepID=A0AAP0PXJ7_9MAGN